MIDPGFIGAFTRWLFKGCKTKLLKEYENGKWGRDVIIGYFVILLLLGIIIALFNNGAF